MEKKIKDLYERFPNEHKDLALFAQHLIDSLNQFKENRLKVYTSGNDKEDSLLNLAFFKSVYRSQEIIFNELKWASEHTEQIEARYQDYLQIPELQAFKEAVPVSYRGLAIFVEELMACFDDLKTDTLYQVGMKVLKDDKSDFHEEKVLLEVIDEVKRDMINELEKTKEDIKNNGKPGYIQHYKDGVH
ncbi:hypothetical protein PU629_14100 [Pullulanibacillus sp. KACC 23026]|uniref:hypothetical protein n=1 Tax=Pullulanibacillus sp. KACC 23026 TaxID=3028315 RepID=UPI0023B129C1|nr:hypothetical protein [Pullulanibacillus sp. KACC 23026]WEG11293.1 hypothetical protein PU629_14100 [Pullulanibacillus sp. KACC 23026]